MDKADLTKYLFRTTTLLNPFVVGDFMHLQEGRPIRQLLDDLDIYVTPALYSRAKNTLLGANLFSIERPLLAPETIASGVNSAYHFIQRDKRKTRILKKFADAIRSGDYSDPVIKAIIDLHNKTKHAARKGGLYLNTLLNYDKTHDTTAYPEILLKVKLLKNQLWLKLKYKLKLKAFIGLKSGKIYLPLSVDWLLK